MAIGDEVLGAAGVGGDGGDACGVGFLDGLAEGFEFAGVDEDVEGGEGVGELGAGLGAEEAGGGEEFTEAWFEGPGADDGEGGSLGRLVMAWSRWRPFSGARRPTYPMMRLVGSGWWWSG